MNVLLVALDTLRADHLSCYGYKRATSPTLDRFASEAVRFERCYAPAIPTQPSFTTTFTGQHSITHGIVTHGGERDLDWTRPWLPHYLLKADYTTCAVDNLGTSMKPWFLWGYEFYIDPSRKHKHPQKVKCDEINSRAIPWLRNHRDEKFFMFVHYWDPHTPYLPPERYRPLFYEGDPTDPAKRGILHELYKRLPHADWWRGGFIKELAPEGREITDVEYIVSMYDSEIRYLDDGVAKLLATLDETGLADDTVVIFFSDHGEEMYEHDTFFDHHGLYEGNIHVPLLVRWPKGGKAGHVVPNLVQHVDIAPTILDILGLEIPATMEGTSLVPLLKGEKRPRKDEVLITEECTYQKKWAILTDGHKLIVNRDTRPDIYDKPTLELFDMQADPEEMHNIADQRPEVVSRLKEQLADWIAAMIKKHGLSGDPLIEQDITLGKNMREWFEKRNYW